MSNVPKKIIKFLKNEQVIDCQSWLFKMIQKKIWFSSFLGKQEEEKSPIV
jgi:hypothetical protein